MLQEISKDLDLLIFIFSIQIIFLNITFLIKIHNGRGDI